MNIQAEIERMKKIAEKDIERLKKQSLPLQQFAKTQIEKIKESNYRVWIRQDGKSNGAIVTNEILPLNIWEIKFTGTKQECEEYLYGKN